MALMSDACGAGLWAISIRYCLIRIEAPAAAGVAIDVPLNSSYHCPSSLDPPDSWASHDRTYIPGAITSGLIRPSSVGPSLR